MELCTGRQTAMKGSVDKGNLTAGGHIFVRMYFNELSTAQQHKVLLTALLNNFYMCTSIAKRYNVNIASSMPAYCTMTLYQSNALPFTFPSISVAPAFFDPGCLLFVVAMF